MSENPNRVAILETAGGDHYTLELNPSVETVQKFVSEQNHRHANGIPAGPSGIVAQRIISAHYYPSELDFRQGKHNGKRKIELDD